jgi:hypothetical protein
MPIPGQPTPGRKPIVPGQPLSPPDTGRGIPRPVFRILSVAQLKVLALLATCRGPMSRTNIGDRLNKLGVGYVRAGIIVGEAVGYSDPVKRKKFEDSKAGGSGKKPSLLTLGFLSEKRYDIDGVSELGLKITPEGRAFLAQWEERLKDRGLPPILPELPMAVRGGVHDDEDKPPLPG